MDVSTMERLNRLSNHAENEKTREEQKELGRVIILNDLALKIKDLFPRIANLITLYDKCVELGIKIPERDLMYGSYDSAKPYGYDAEFIAEGIHHHVGFVTRRRSKLNQTAIGILNGGANGCYDLIVTPNRIKGLYNGDYKTLVEINNKTYKNSRYDMEKFLREFDTFERAFLTWIDSLD